MIKDDQLQPGWTGIVMAQKARGGAGEPEHGSRGSIAIMSHRRS
jgi:hypothetical protein